LPNFLEKVGYLENPLSFCRLGLSLLLLVV
jgi:hypothetical protein